MKPSMSMTQDSDTLRDLGRASIQIVHDLKNQLNGLKLYATFLRKRLEKTDRRDDELETVNKLIGGLDRAATDLSTIIQYGREIEIKKQAGFDMQKVLRGICADLNVTNGPVSFQSNGEPLPGEFDPQKLTDALKWISMGAIKHARGAGVITVSTKREINNSGAAVIVEWTGGGSWDHDPFLSFAGSDEIRMSLAARIVKAHGGSSKHGSNSLIVTLPI
jgi:signal transduction histidine kinase